MCQVRTLLNHTEYEIDSNGIVWAKANSGRKGCPRTRHTITPTTNQYGHLKVRLRSAQRCAIKYVHRLMLETFVGPCPPGMECRHLNGDPTDNRLCNLVWGTHSENIKDMYRHGTQNTKNRARGEQVGTAKLRNEEAQYIFLTYWDGAASQIELARAFNVNKRTIYQVVHRKSFNNVWADKQPYD